MVRPDTSTASTPPCPIPYITLSHLSSFFLKSSLKAHNRPVSSNTPAARAPYSPYAHRLDCMKAAQEPLPYSTSLWHMFSNIMANTTNAAAPMNSDEAFAPVRLCHIMPSAIGRPMLTMADIAIKTIERVGTMISPPYILEVYLSILYAKHYLPSKGS